MSEDPTLPRFFPPEGAPKVIQAIVEVMRNIPAVPKSGRNLEQKYNYVEATVLTAKIQDAMIKAGLVLVPRELSRSVQSGILFIRFAFDAHSGDQSIFAIGNFTGACRFQFQRSGAFDDKAANKCLTTALKQFEIALFKIPADVADIERDEEVREPSGRGDGRDNPPDEPPDDRPPPHDTAPDDQPPSDDGPPDDEPVGDAEPGDEAPVDFQTRVREFAQRLKTAQNQREADALWSDEAVMLRQCNDTTYRWLADAYEGRWNIRPPKV
jgi:hypothetical protein